MYAITPRGEVKIAVQRGGSWVHERVIRLEYVARVLRQAIKGEEYLERKEWDFGSEIQRKRVKLSLQA